MAHCGERIVALGDWASRLWLVRSHNPYLPEIATIADLAAPEVGGNRGLLSLSSLIPPDVC